MSVTTKNLFGNDNAVISSDTFFDQGSYEVFYEKQLPTIKNNPHNANLDAFLKGNTELIFCEMKMTEWLFNRPSDLRESYLDKSLYYDPEAYEAFRECISCLINWEPSDYRTYRSRFYLSFSENR